MPATVCGSARSETGLRGVFGFVLRKAVGEPEVQHLQTVLRDPTMTFALFRSRWTMPRSCACISASAICRLYRKNVSWRQTARNDQRLELQRPARTP